MKYEYEYVENRLRSEMYQGNMHACLRDVGRIVGGYIVSGRLDTAECESLKSLAVSMSINKTEGERKWDEAVRYGQGQPLARSAMTFARTRDEGRAIGWDEVVNPNDYVIIDENWLETDIVEAPDDAQWNPCAQLREYLSLLFERDEHVAYCTDPYQVDGKYIPTRGTYHKTVGELMSSLNKNTPIGFEEAVGTPNEECGAWIVINPVDGNGRKDSNVTDFRYALVESDVKPIDEQVAIYRKLELPCVCIVHSGGKSAHAIVRVNASNIEEYRKRVDFLFEVCANNGLIVDKQNRNPSRYSRMPGVMRNGNKQFIIDRNCGKSSWDEWETWIKDINDNLPDFEPLTDEELKNPPELAPELIEGILRINHKMCIVGPSKAGKSFLLIQLAIAVSEGWDWLGRKCRQGRVLYVNLELDRNSCTRRFISVYNDIGRKPRRNSFIDRWNLRGCCMPMNQLTPKLIRRAKKRGYELIIIDPIYKVLTGDENSASEMAQFCNFFDKVAKECGSAIVYCHHHSKGAQFGKNSMDRASGSGVFARDPDAMIDIIQLESKKAVESLVNVMECKAIERVADELTYDTDWKSRIEEDAKIVSYNYMEAIESMFSESEMNKIRAAKHEANRRYSAATPWRMSFTLREFMSPEPENVFFSYPRHIVDPTDTLKDAVPAGMPEPRTAKRTGNPNAPKTDRLTSFKAVVELAEPANRSVKYVCASMKVSERSVWYYIKKAGYSIKNGLIIVPEGGEE